MVMKGSPRHAQKASTASLFLAFFCVGLAVYAMTVLITSAVAQEKNVEIRYIPPTHTNHTSGSEMYAQYCAPCHGMKGQGDGPAAPAFKKRPTNLTLLAKEHGGKFPRILVISALNQGNHVSAHANAQMPVWSDAFRHIDSTHQGVGMLRIQRLTDFVESLQLK